MSENDSLPGTVKHLYVVSLLLTSLSIKLAKWTDENFELMTLILKQGIQLGTLD